MNESVQGALAFVGLAAISLVFGYVFVRGVMHVRVEEIDDKRRDLARDLIKLTQRVEKLENPE